MLLLALPALLIVSVTIIMAVDDKGMFPSAHIVLTFIKCPLLQKKVAIYSSKSKNFITAEPNSPIFPFFFEQKLDLSENGSIFIKMAFGKKTIFV